MRKGGEEIYKSKKGEEKGREEGNMKRLKKVDGKEI